MKGKRQHNQLSDLQFLLRNLQLLYVNYFREMWLFYFQCCPLSLDSSKLLQKAIQGFKLNKSVFYGCA